MCCFQKWCLTIEVWGQPRTVAGACVVWGGDSQGTSDQQLEGKHPTPGTRHFIWHPVASGRNVILRGCSWRLGVPLVCGGGVVQGQQVEKNLGSESDGSGFDPNYWDTMSPSWGAVIKKTNNKCWGGCRGKKAMHTTAGCKWLQPPWK